MGAAEPQPDDFIEPWLERWGRIYHFSHQDVVYIFRAITRREYRAALMIDDPLERDEEVAAQCLLWPQNWKANDAMPAGIPTVLCGEILKASGCGPNLKENFSALQEFVSSDLETQMETLIDHVFSGGGNFKRYQNWSHQELFEAYWRAQWILEQTTGVAVKPQMVNVNGKHVDVNNLNPKQRSQLLAQQRALQRREAPPAGDQASISVQGEEGSVSLDAAISAYSEGPAALSNMAEFMRKQQKFEAQRAIRK